MKSFMMKQPISRILIPAAAVGLLTFAIISVTSHQEAVATKPSIPPSVSRFDKTVGGIGVVEPKSELIDIGTNIPGIITNLYVEVGDEVKKGDKLFTIDDRELKAELIKAEAQIRTASIQVEDARQALALYEKVKDKRAISSDEIDRKKYAYKLASAKLAEAKASFNSINTNISRSTVTAPIEATILRVNAKPGEYANAGVTSTPLMVVGDVSLMHVRVEVDETDAIKVKPDAQAYASLRGSGNEQIPLKFVRKELLLSPKRSLTGDGNERVDTRVQEIIYSFDNNKLGANIGQQMDVFIDAK